ncbi:putative RNA-binding protein with PIN domain [Elusimicrobium posterum]|uniref:NYN domain-containing protein n=1 Tax=Elusimicrobium posterum TaxID=3116653 RepID=UPI003C759738
MYTTTKSATYIIDGHNFVRSCLMADAQTEDNLTKEFLQMLEELEGIENFYGSDFRVIFDGGYRNLGYRALRNVNVRFAEDETADTLIYEQAVYLHNNGQRVIVVTSDLALQQDIKSHNIKTMFCQKFFNTVNRLIDNSYK